MRDIIWNAIIVAMMFLSAAAVFMRAAGPAPQINAADGTYVKCEVYVWRLTRPEIRQSRTKN